MTTFIWPYDGNQVSLAGSFNNWTPQPMKRDNELGFTLSIPLENGTYQYKFIIDGRRWCYDLLHPTSTDDRGNRNNVIEVGAVRQKGGSGGTTHAPHPQAKAKPITHVEAKEVPPPRGQPSPKVQQEPKEVSPRGQPSPKAPQERKSESGGDGGDVAVSEGDVGGGGKKQQNQKQQNQQQKQQNQKQNRQQQQPKGPAVSAVAKTQGTNLIKTVKSYGVPFYVGDVDCENSTEDVIATAQMFQKALPDIGCMLLSGGTEKFIVAAVVPENKTGTITALEWVNTALSIISGYQATGSDTLAHGEIPANPDAGVFPIKLKDLCRGPTFVLLRAKGLVKEEESEDEMYFFDE